MHIRNIAFLVALSTIVSATILYNPFNHFLNNKSTLPKIDYDKEWKKVDSLINKGLPESALKVVIGIYEQAKNENNAPQHVKAVIYKIRLKSDFEEDNIVKSIEDLNAEIATSSFPVTPVLHSLIAEMYWRYYQENRYYFLNRTETIDFKEEDMKTWDLKKIIEKVIYHYKQSVINTEKLQNIKTDLYDPVIIKDSITRQFRPTLYDFLAHRAVDFFMNTESGLINPAYKFEINNEKYFDLPDIFVNLHLNTIDTFSLKFYALNILQDLEKFHLNDKDPGGLIDVTLKRLNFVRKNSVTELKDSLYLKTLNSFEKKYFSSPHSTRIANAIATEYYRTGRLYNPLQSDDYKFDIKKAHDKCEEAIKRFPESDGAINCKVLKEQTEIPILSLTTEYVEIPEKPFRALMSYKNINEVFFKIISISPEKDVNITEKYYGKELIKQYLKFDAVKEWSVKTPDDGDFQSHSAEIAIPALPAGYYVLLASPAKDFSVEATPVAYENFWISGISFIARAKNNYSYDFYVLDRATGQPMKNVNVETFYREYNYSSRTYESTKWKTFTTDDKGYFSVPPLTGGSKYSRYFYATFRSGKDMFTTKSYFYQYRHDLENKEKLNKTFFFTDRAIYRPGQTVYFKGILLESDGDKYSIRPNAKTKVSFFDANYQEVSSLELTSNEYGTVTGTFTAPQGGLNGEMYITDTYGYSYFSVEEYKRPKFEVLFQPVKGSYKLDQDITVKGNAKAYAGNNIDGATVKYRVYRTARFPYRGYWSRWSCPSSPSMEIISGITTTDENGEFEIKFNAIPDRNISKKLKPVFNYSITADVTDINGETHSSQQNISVGYTALIMNINIPEKTDKNAENKFRINATNLNGEKEAVSGEITIYKLKQPEKLFRDRLWSRPDKHIISKDEFYKLFPCDLYDDEDNIEKWNKENKMLSMTFDTKKDSIFDGTRFKNWPDGQYVLEIKAKDAFGELIENKNYFTVYSEKNKYIPENTTSWFKPVKTQGEPGEKASFIVGTKDSDVKVIYEIESADKIVNTEFLTLNNEQRLLEIPIKEEYRGNFNINIIFIKKNRVYVNSSIVYVPYTNKELDIQFETFRNKLLPGQQEEWKIKITGKKGEKVAAEMLASMYDASLDAFSPHSWAFNILNYYYSNISWQTEESFSINNSLSVYMYKSKYLPVNYIYDQLNWFGYNYYQNNYTIYKRGMYSVSGEAEGYGEGGYGEYDEMTATGGIITKKNGGEGKAAAAVQFEAPMIMGDKELQDSQQANIPILLDGDNATRGDFSGVQARTNFNETAFFLPQLQTDENGDIIIKFTVPEALTKWKIMGFAHTKDLKSGFIEKELITQKDLMVVPNPPRFFREFDRISFSAKVSNISEKDLDGEARIEFFDALTMKPIDELVQNKENIKIFSVKKGQSTALAWDIFIPEGIEAITYRIVAKAGNFSDGEEMTIPVLTNRMLVTESFPLPINGKQSKTYSFTKLLESGNSATLRNHKLTLEFTSNPAWYAVQALPYLMEYPYECSEQVFSRYYANSIASYIANSSPRIKAVFDSWKNFTPDALLSNLQKNQELKALVLEETPWVLDAKSENERKQRVALLFDFTRMTNELDNAERLLIKKQASNGGWPWFDGMPESRYITQHIITGFGHLKHLGIRDIKENYKVSNMVEKGVKYLDNRIKEDLEYIKKWYPETINENHLSSEQIQYLYARSYFLEDIPLHKANKEAYDYFIKQAQTYWLKNNIYMQGMISLALHRNGDTKTPADIINSLKEKSLHSEEMGMYWRDLSAGYYWYQAPIETQALLIEAFDEVAGDTKSVEEMKIWLLKQKQTQDWKTTKATTEACYALLLRGSNILESNELVKINIGNLLIEPAMLENNKVEAGTGYFKTSWAGNDIKPEMGKVTVTKNDEGVAWGALYWQYFEQLDKITPAATPLKLDKKLFRQINTATGPKIEPITEKTSLKVGDKITVRIELRVDRDMEYVHMKDMRASGFEPVNVMSGYKYRNGLGYYESTRDAATNFFFAYIAKGTYVFEYPLVVSHKGDFSNGITTIQCMYAPEFSAHSEGIRVKVTE